MNGAKLLVTSLRNEGVQAIVGVPGDENLDVIKALRSSTIKLVVTRHEQAAARQQMTKLEQPKQSSRPPVRSSCLPDLLTLTLKGRE
jgi:hypothetical protein